MRPFIAALLLLAYSTSFAVEFVTTPVDDGIRVERTDWPWWRGPWRDGSADPHQTPPTIWDEKTNVAWKVAVPGRGHGSPTVVGNGVYLATADRARDLQSVLCYDRADGGLIWEAVVHRGGLMQKNKKASQASSSVAWDGERLLISFLNDGAVFTTALSPEGQRLWQTRISDYIIHQGYAASPAVYQDLVIVSADNKGGGTLAALDRKTGEIVWRRDRPRFPNYSSPILLRVAEQDQLIMIGCERVSSLDPLTGKTNWEVEGSTTECVTSTVTDGQLVFSSGGYPDNHVSAINGDGSGEVVWRNGSRVYVPSMLIKDGYLFAVLDAGIAVCWRAKDGQQMWKKRLGGTFSASPVLVGNKVFASNEEGETFIYIASPEGFDQIAKNQLGNSVFATPTIVGSRIYARVADQRGDHRQELLYCLSGGRG